MCWKIAQNWSIDAAQKLQLFKQTNNDFEILDTRSLGALRAPTSRWRPFGPIDFVLRALRALRPVCGKIVLHLLIIGILGYDWDECP